MVLLKKVVVAEMQGSDGTDVFYLSGFSNSLQHYNQQSKVTIATKKDFDVRLKKALLEEHLACWVCSKWWEPFISFLAS